MAERRMAKVVGEAQRLGQILVDPQCACDRPADLCDLDAVGQPDPEVITVGGDEDLGLVTQPAERDRVNDAVAVALENVPRTARRGVGLVMKSAARVRGSGGKRFAGPHSVPSGTIWSDSELTQRNELTPTDSRSSEKICASELP